MRKFILTVLTFAALTASLSSQQLSEDQKKVLDAARTRYYNIESRGFTSFTCSVNFDFSTVPLLPSMQSEPNLALLKSTDFTVTVDPYKATTRHRYPIWTSNQAAQSIAQATGVLESLVTGLFLTWPTKGVHGPIPMFDKQIKSIQPKNDGYEIELNFPGDPVQITMDRNYLVSRIVSVGGKIDEQPEYTATPDGLVFSRNHAIDNSNPNERTEVWYELENTHVDGFSLPTRVHLRVNDSIDVKYTLSNCSVEKGVAVNIAAPSK